MPQYSGVFLIHIMKTGGNSVGRLLQDEFGSDVIYPPHDSEHLWNKMDLQRCLNIGSSRRREIAFYSMHLPSWVAAHIAPAHLATTMLREPLSRTVSHLRHISRSLPDTPALDELYERQEYGRRLRNYQTRMFSSLPRHAHSEHLIARDQRQRAGEDPVFAQELLTGLDTSPWSRTALSSNDPLDSDALRRAKRQLEKVDEIGVTDDLDGLLVRISRHFTFELHRAARLNSATDSLSVPRSLKRRLESDLLLDLELYEYAKLLIRDRK
ncbi:MAG: hypothetical protein V3V01_03515 [Acidimicrobiales bacterium]